MAKPTDIKLHQKSRVLEVLFDDGYSCNLTCEYLRVNSPSAEVQGHGPGQEVLQVGKEEVNITQLEPTGHYGIKIHFDDDHNTGIYRWDYLYGLGQHYEENWQRYLDKLADAGHTRKETLPKG